MNGGFRRIERLPPYIFNIINAMKMEARRKGEDIIDLGMGNPDIPSPPEVVEKLVEASRNGRNHRYSASRGIPKMRQAICDRYKKLYNVYLDPETEAVATIGVKEGLSHLALAMITAGDVVFAPTPTYPIHHYAVVIAGGDLRKIPLTDDLDFFDELTKAVRATWPKPKMIIISFPHNPTTKVVDLNFFQRIVDFARENGIYVVHDHAYSDLNFDGYVSPSILQVEGAKDVAVEFYSMSKSYSMPGWRVGFCLGNKEMVGALTKIKSYLDYGMFQPIQIASIVALNTQDEYVKEINEIYLKRRDCLCDGLAKAGWQIAKPKATMFVWAKIPEEFLKLGSLEFSKFLMHEAKVAVSPGIGFGEYGDDHVRFSLIENEHRLKQAVKGIEKVISGKTSPVECG